ncbi:MAG: carboxypeptidase regulatory-like domain-containing protein [Hormoscilla sp. GUM202]|nr:carboxypeptidase regulatory-like domain-containing protein [Hormoscilla sp. GUM202]
MNCKLVIPLIFCSVMGWPTEASAHGAIVEHKIIQAVEIKATYDSGEPMANAQITVYAPDELATPWLQGTADELGQFMFTPDVVGSWQVKVRLAGHGEIVSIAIGDVGQKSPKSTVNPLQKFAIAGAVIWGFVGTALFFSRHNKNAHS